MHVIFHSSFWSDVVIAGGCSGCVATVSESNLLLLICVVCLRIVGKIGNCGSHCFACDFSLVMTVVAIIRICT